VKRKLKAIGFSPLGLAVLFFSLSAYLSMAHAAGNRTYDDAEFMSEMDELLRPPDELDLNLGSAVESSRSGVIGTTVQSSAALQVVFDQAEITYMPVIIDLNMQVALNELPDVFATHIGLVLQRQKLYLNQHPEYASQFEALQKEALTFLRQLARAHNYRHPTYDFELSEAVMERQFYDALNGGMNEMYINLFGIDPAKANLPFILNQAPDQLRWR